MADEIPIDAGEVPAVTTPPAAAACVVVPPPNEAETITRLAALKPMDYDRLRKEEAKALGIQVKTLDDLVRAERNQGNANDRMPFVDSEPWSASIDPPELLNEITAVIRRFIIMDEPQAQAAALWVAHTYLVAEADTSPILIANAPERACAKTLLQDTLARMSYRPLPASNASLSSLFRAVESWRPTLFIDEADTFFRENAELHGLVNAGYKRGGYILRSESTGDSFEPRMFSVYGAKSIAGIALEKHLPDSTMSRGIVINLRRKMAHETVERMRNADGAVFDRIASKLARFAMDYSRQIRLAKPALPEKLSDREQDNWEPLLAIAECAGPEWLARATAAALSLSASTETSASTGNELLADIRHVFSAKRTLKISTVDLIDALISDETNAWATYNRGRPLTPRQLAKLLSTYGIQPKTVRMTTGTPKGYDTDQFADAFSRYLDAPEKLPQRRNAKAALSCGPVTAPKSADQIAEDEQFLQAIAAESEPFANCGGVADTNVPLTADPQDIF